MRWLDGITNSIDMNLSKLWESEGQGSLACCSSWGCRVGHDLETEQHCLLIPSPTMHHSAITILGFSPLLAWFQPFNCW